jgi:hypothetical protein
MDAATAALINSRDLLTAAQRDRRRREIAQKTEDWNRLTSGLNRTARNDPAVREKMHALVASVRASQQQLSAFSILEYPDEPKRVRWSPWPGEWAVILGAAAGLGTMGAVLASLLRSGLSMPAQSREHASAF